MVTALDPKTALVLIDLQKGITSFPIFRPAADVIAKAGELVEAFRAKGLPVVFINVNPFKGTFKALRVQSPSMPATAEAAMQAKESMEAAGFFDIVPELEVKADDLLITKGSWNAFFGTSLHDELQKRGITGIVLAGIATSIGVEGTARAAHEWGYNIAFAEDAMSDMQEAAHQHSIASIFPRIGETDTTAAIISKL